MAGGLSLACATEERLMKVLVNFILKERHGGPANVQFFKGFARGQTTGHGQKNGGRPGVRHLVFGINYYLPAFCILAASSGLMTSILAPFFISSALGTLMMSLVSGATGGAGGGGGVGDLLSSSSTSKIRVAFGGMPGRPPSP